MLMPYSYCVGVAGSRADRVVGRAAATAVGGGRGGSLSRVAFCAFAWSLLSSALGCWPLFEEQSESAGKDRERAARAPIVVVGYVERTFRDPLVESDRTYSIDFRIARVIKGRDLVRGVRETLAGSERLYRISNFGGFKWCFSDVDEHRTYVLYLQVVLGHLSAFYTRLVDAAEPWSAELEDALIEQTQGYRPWTDWSACSASCDGGVMRRTRACARAEGEPCADGNVEKKHCNTFPCSRTKNLVAIGGLRSLPRGVIRFWEDSRMYFDVTPNFYAQFPVARLFEARWPTDYSVIVRVRPRRTRYPREGQYLFSVSDAAGKQYLGLRLYPSPTLEVTTANGSAEEMPAAGAARERSGLPSAGGVNDGSWLQFAFGIRGSAVELYYKCFRRVVETLGSEPAAGAMSSRASNVVLGTKMFRMERGSAERYEGTIDQLLITSDAGDAARQCSTRFWTETVPQQPKKTGLTKQGGLPCSKGGCDNGFQADDQRSTQATIQSAAGHWAWSEWSPCSSSCGPGKRTRVPRCLLHALPAADASAAAVNQAVNLDDCIPYYVPPVHIKECYEKECLQCQCDNGGTCTEEFRCICELGWTGEHCEEPICNRGCSSRGVCIRPGVCECPAGWSGEQCDIATCFPSCRNGGTCVGPDSCRCPQGFTGPTCALRVIHCSIPCQNAGTCSGVNTCDCRAGFTGRHCESEAAASHCWPPCLNGGTCGGSNSCQCPSGYTGSRCERDSCGGCRHGGVCNGTSGTCLCTSEPERTGKLCEFEVQPQKCQDERACLNGGLCVDYNFCYCRPGHWGNRCEFRECKRYKVVKEIKLEEVRKRKYRYYACPQSGISVCREPAGFETEMKNVSSSRVDTTQCDD